MLQIVCVNHNNYLGRGREYVEILFDMVNRNLPEGTAGQFTCFTNDPHLYSDGIITRPTHEDLEGWWQKLFLFKKGLFPDEDRIVYFDLDTCITGALDDILKYSGPFGILRDAYRPNGIQSSVMMWRANHHPPIWEDFIAEGYPRLTGGDQEWLERYPWCFADILQDRFPSRFRSYKKECAYDIPNGTSVVYFHGTPRPHEVKDNWVEKVWKIGGGTTMELMMIPNVTNEMLLDNIRASLASDHETLADQYAKEKKEKLCIVGGGPSLEDDICGLKVEKLNGSKIWSLNGAYDYILAHGIVSDGHVIADARKQNAQFVPDDPSVLLLYSAQCHPETFAKAKGKVIVWYPGHIGILEELKKYKRRAAILESGSTVGLKALSLAQLMGYRDVHLYGYDSSYYRNRNHAYQQDLNADENVIEVEVNNRQFKCAPWMARQAQEFREVIPNYIKAGLSITVHGDGLLPYIARLMQ